MTNGVAAVLASAIAVLSCNAAKADVVIQAEKAAIRTEGGPASGSGWNLWSNGYVGHPRQDYREAVPPGKSCTFQKKPYYAEVTQQNW